MNVDYAFLANSAEISADGRLFVMGADFTELYGQYPLVVPAMSLIVKINCSPEEVGTTYHFSAEFRKPDGERMDHPVIKLDFVPPAITLPSRKGTLTFVLGLYGVVFPVAGTYTVHVLIDDDEKKAFHLFANDVPKPEQSPTAAP